MRGFRQIIAIRLGWYDNLQRTASVQDRAGEHLVRTVNKAAQPDKVSRLGERCANSVSADRDRVIRPG